MRILLIEDNDALAANVCDFLDPRGFATDWAGDGLTGLHLAVTHEFDAIVLDLGLPGIDGLRLCRLLREQGDRAVPVLMLTARDTLDDKLAGFDAGADDYLVKPFALRELEARLRALARRAQPQGPLRVADLEFDPDRLIVTRAGQRIQLTPATTRLLEVLLRAAGRVVGRDELERAVWGDDLPDSDALRTHLYTLRNAIDKPFDRPLLRTVRGFGWVIDADPEDATTADRSESEDATGAAEPGESDALD